MSDGWINDHKGPKSKCKYFYDNEGKKKRILIWSDPFYDKWVQMKLRVETKRYFEKSYCSEEWKTFSNFKKWMETKNFKGMDLDKDILIPNNRTYSSETCCFVPNYINSCILVSSKKENNLPLGVTFHKASNKYVSQCKIAKKGKKYSKYYNDPQDAHREWQKFKISGIISAINRWMDDGLYFYEDHNLVLSSLIARIDKINMELLHDKITTKI